MRRSFSLFGWVSRGTAKVLPWLRLSAFAFVVCVVIAVLAARSAVADVGTQAIVVGRQLSELKDLVDGSHRVRLNGELVNVASATTELPLSKVLDRFEANCANWGNGLEDDFKRLSAAGKEAVFSQLGQRVEGSKLGILRQETPFEGVVGCIVRTPEQRSIPLLDRLGKLVDTSDLGELGLVRYAYARRTPEGRTHVVTSWTDGSFRFDRFSPAPGTDAPGTDPNGFGRPLGGVRLLSAEIEGVPHGVRVYLSKVPAKQLLDDYEKRILAAGYAVVDHASDDAPGTRAYTRLDVDLIVVTNDDAKTGGTAVTVVESRNE